MTAFEFRPAGSRAQTGARQLEWAETPHGDGALDSDLTPMLPEIGQVADAAVDLVRIATAAYLADKLVARPPASFTRSLELTVHMVDPSRWDDATLGKTADLLQSLTGDEWILRAAAAEALARPAETTATAHVSRVALLSGGLDSFAGAAITSEDGDVAYLGHWDFPTVKGAQDNVRRHFADVGRPLDYLQVRHAVRLPRKERTQRTRSFLFMALGIATASARGATIMEVAENGFTSLNPPLGPERGGPLSTRSTHPMTISRMNDLAASVGIEIPVVNPHLWRTKGELVREASTHLANFEDGVALTLSCAKLDGWYYKGGNANKHCGLCYACIVRRGAIAVSGVQDLTDYLAVTLAEPVRRKLAGQRGSDTAAVRMRLEDGIDQIDILGLGPFPADFDLDANIGRAVELCGRALDEIRRVPLP